MDAGDEEVEADDEESDEAAGTEETAVDEDCVGALPLYPLLPLAFAAYSGPAWIMTLPGRPTRGPRQLSSLSSGGMVN